MSGSLSTNPFQLTYGCDDVVDHIPQSLLVVECPTSILDQAVTAPSFLGNCLELVSKLLCVWTQIRMC